MKVRRLITSLAFGYLAATNSSTRAYGESPYGCLMKRATNRGPASDTAGMPSCLARRVVSPSGIEKRGHPGCY